MKQSNPVFYTGGECHGEPDEPHFGKLSVTQFMVNLTNHGSPTNVMVSLTNHTSASSEPTPFLSTDSQFFIQPYGTYINSRIKMFVFR